MFSSEAWLANPSSGFYNGVATQSLRFDGSSRLEKNFSSEGSRQKWTISVWVKRTAIEHNLVILGYSPSSTFYGALYFHNNRIRIYDIQSSSFKFDLQTNALHRDASAWYHIVVSADTTQSTASNRIKMYVNGVQVTSFAVETYPSLNLSSLVTDDCSHSIGRYADVTTGSFKGYMSEFNLVDGLSFFSDTSGTANTSFNINSFGETKNGVWIAKEYTGSYGTNGFRLQFNQTGTGTASTSTIGADTSGNTHHFTSSGIVASDCAMPDSPENNFATLNSLYATANTNVTLSKGNLKATVSQVAYQQTFGSIGVSSGKWYVEMKQNGTTNSSNMMGISSDNNFSILQSTSSYIGSNSGGENYAFYMHNGQKYSGGSGASYGSRTTDGQIIGVALDLDNGKIYFSVDGTYIASGDPAGGTGFAYENIASSTYYFGITLYTNGIPSCVWNFGQDSTFVGTETATSNADGNGYGAFHTAPPSGFLALCTANLEEPTISPAQTTQADDYFNTVLYTGNESSRSIAVGFQSDWVWIKNRETTRYHRVYDSSRGATKALYTNSVDDEETNATELTAFNSNGFTLGAGVGSNENNDTFVSWNWKAGGATTADNSAGAGNTPTAGSVKIDGVNLGSALAGSIPATRLTANTTAGFSIVTYTGSGSNATVGHGLAISPDMVIVKNRTAGTTGAWLVYHSANTSAPETDYLRLNETNATADINSVWNDTAPTSSVFSIGTSSNVNTNTHTYLAYCFHSVEGYSKMGSYTGNGSTDGTFVYTGFRPAWVLIRPTIASQWLIMDSARNVFNPLDKRLFAEKSDAESSATYLDFLSNGFKFRYSGAFNSNETIYMAFAEAPFKYANAR